MTLMRRLGTVCLIAGAALALAGVGTAAAEQGVFCKANETPCKSTNQWPKGTEVFLESTEVLRLATEPGFEYGCNEFLLKGEITATGGSTETVAAALPLQGIAPCTCSSTSIQAGNMRFNWLSGTMNAAVTVEKFDFSFYCASTGIGCTFSGKITKGVTLTGGAPAVLTFNEVSLPKTAGPIGICGTSGTLSAKGNFGGLFGPLYVSNA